MENKVSLVDGLIHIDYGGKQTPETIDALIVEAGKITPKLREDKHPVLFLVDVSNIGELTASARLRAVKFLKEADYDRIATFGGSPFIASMNNLMMNAMRQRDKLGYFNSREEAVTWLRK